MKILSLISAVMAAAGLLAATPTVTKVTAQQRYPWNGKMDIVVTMNGASNEVAQATCTFTATNSATQAKLTMTSVTETGTGPVAAGTETWTRRYVWDATADVGEVQIADVAITVEATIGVQLWENGPYWAECNVGASKPEEYGYYFWWGDTVGYKRNASNDGWVSVKDGTSFTFDFANCPTGSMNDSSLYSLGYLDLTGSLAAAHDAATAYLGAQWRMPKGGDWADLTEVYCTTTWTTRNGVYGLLMTGKGDYASRSIFLPAAGYGDESDLYCAGSHGGYWSSMTYSLEYTGVAWMLGFDSGECRRYWNGCAMGRSVRPLREFAQTGVTGSSMTTHMALDTRTGARANAGTVEQICFSPAWEDSADGAVATVSLNGVAVTNATEAGSFEWTPTQDGTYVFTHTVAVNGAQTGETLSVTFVVDGLNPDAPTISSLTVTQVTAQQRYPWNGKVDIVVTMSGASNDVAKVTCTFTATNSATQAALTMTSITESGTGPVVAGTETWTRRYVWDATADVGEVQIADVAITVVATMPQLGGVQLWANGPYWAECNVGASKPEEYGYYFWWGDTVGYKRNASNNGWVSVKDGTSFSFGESSCPITRDNWWDYIDSADNLVAAHDAATALLGAPWRIPTGSEMNELIKNCTTTWITTNGVSGRLVTGKGDYATKSIFLPAAGYGLGNFLYDTGSRGEYWSSSSYIQGELLTIMEVPIRPSDFSFGTNYFYQSWYIPSYGRSVRPFREFALSAVMTTHAALDTRTGARANTGTTEQIRLSPAWETSVNGAVATVSLNGVVVTNATETGSFEWTPTQEGTYVFTHTVAVNGAQVGETLSGTFVFEIKPDTPTISPASGTTFDKSLTVSMACASEGATIHYTTNGTTPTVDSPVYKSFTITGTRTIKAVAFYANGNASDVAVAEYTILRTVTFDANGGACATDSVKVFDRAAVGELPTVSRAGYDFLGWFTDEAGGEQVSSETVVTADVTWYARWSVSSYTVRFNANGGSTDMSAVTRNYGTAIGSMTDAWRTGYDFLGWFTSASGGSKATAATTVTGDTTLYARWQLKSYTVTVNSNGGDSVPAFTRTHGSTIGSLPIPTRVGHVFKGWFTAPDGGERVGVSTAVTDNLVLYAHWATYAEEIAEAMPGAGNVRFSTDDSAPWTRDDSVSTDGESVRSYPVAAGGSSALEAQVYGPGNFMFDWRVSSAAGVGVLTYYVDGVAKKSITGSVDWRSVDVEISGAGTHTVRWVYSKGAGGVSGSDCGWVDAVSWSGGQFPTVSYSVTFDANGGQCGTRTVTVAAGASVGSLPTASRAGYAFVGWFTASTGGSQVSESSIVGSDVTWYARWQANVYSISYVDTKGADNQNPSSYTVEDAVSFLALPDVDGWRFVGWSVTGIPAGSTGDRRVTANWEEVTVPDIGGGDDDDPMDAGVANVYDGVIVDADGLPLGYISVKTAKASGKGDVKVSKVTATVQMAGEAKKVTVKASVPVAEACLTQAAADGRVLDLSFSRYGMWGTFDGYEIDGVRNLLASKAKSDVGTDAKAAADAAFSALAGSYVMAYQDENGWNGLSVTVAAKGKVRVSGKLANGTSISTSSQLIVGSDYSVIPVIYTKKGTSMSFNIYFDNDTREAEVFGYYNAVMSPVGILDTGVSFYLGEEFYDLFDDYSPCGEFLPDGVLVEPNGSKWLVANGAKAGSIKFKDGEVVDVKESNNPSGLKLSYTAKTGIFKGSFKVYALDENDRLKTFKATVTGVVVDGVGYGTATIKKLGSCSVMIAE